MCEERREDAHGEADEEAGAGAGEQGVVLSGVHQKLAQAAFVKRRR